MLGAAPAELEDEERGVLGFTLTEPDAEDEPDGPGGADGVVVEPLDDEEAHRVAWCARDRQRYHRRR